MKKKTVSPLPCCSSLLPLATHTFHVTAHEELPAQRTGQGTRLDESVTLEALKQVEGHTHAGRPPHTAGFFFCLLPLSPPPFTPTARPFSRFMPLAGTPREAIHHRVPPSSSPTVSARHPPPLCVQHAHSARLVCSPLLRQTACASSYSRSHCDFSLQGKRNRRQVRSEATRHRPRPPPFPPRCLVSQRLLRRTSLPARTSSHVRPRRTRRRPAFPSRHLPVTPSARRP